MKMFFFLALIAAAAFLIFAEQPDPDQGPGAVVNPDPEPGYQQVRIPCEKLCTTFQHNGVTYRIKAVGIQQDCVDGNWPMCTQIVCDAQCGL